MEKPVTSKDFKCFDDFDVWCQFAIDIFDGKPVTSKDFKCFDDFDVWCQFAIAIFVWNGLQPRDDEEVPVIKIDPRYFRPTEVASLLGDPTKAKQKLGWVPEITLDELVQEMVAADLTEAKKHALLKQHGYNVNASVE